MVNVINPMSLFAARVFTRDIPRQGPKSMFVPFDFTPAGSNGADIILDLELPQQEGWIDFIQTVFIDNTLSGQTFTLLVSGSQQVLTILAGKQAYLPVMAPPKAKFTGRISAPAAGIIKTQLMNVYVEPIVF